jgi:uncharacterized protein YecE (DUF72 family)
MGDILTGGTFARLPNPKIAAALRFFEYAPKPPLPSLATLARFAKQLPGPLRCALVAPRDTWLTSKGPLRPGPELDAGFDWLKRASDILRATAIVLPTAAELTTGERDSALLAAFVERLKKTERLVVVAPRGLWEAEHGVAFAQKADCVYGFDPLEDDAPKGEVVYARIRPMGARPRLTEGHLAQIAERLLRAQANLSYVAVESDQAARDARRLHKALSELGEELSEHSEIAEEEEETEEEETEEEETEEEETEEEEDDHEP